ncbi:MAG: TonB-dependent receptor [Acidobacteriota bacterium]
MSNIFAAPSALAVLIGLALSSTPGLTPLATAQEASANESEEPGEPIQVHEEIEVRGRGTDLIGIASSANEGATSRIQLARRPILRPGELVETAPGVVATQHSGGGKANQFFLRGFNLDHGTDFTTRVGGVPVNFPSHGHGQGYTDLNFLIPEIVSTVQYRKGPYFAETGDFSAAGSLDVELVDRLPGGSLKLALGSFDSRRLLWADSWHPAASSKDDRWVAAIEVFEENGPWTRAEDYDGFKAFTRFSRGNAARGFDLTVLAYDANWLSTDQVPRRAVESGQIGRFDLVDPGPRGSTARYSLAATVHRSTANSLTRWRGYLVGYDFDLISNFTYFLEDPVDGDQFQQVDQRWVGGGEMWHHWHGHWGGRDVEHVAGVQLRYDDIDNGLFRTRDRVRLATVREDAIRQGSGGLFLRTMVHWSDVVRTRLGARVDYLSVDVDSNLGVNSGSEDDVVVSPKLSLILGPWADTEIYLNIGRGFHSNDARGATLRRDPLSGEPASPVDLLVPAWGADLGARHEVLNGWQMTLTLFVLELDSELLFVGDGGATEASRPSRRSGIEWTNYWEIDDHWTLDLDLTVTDSAFTDPDPAGDSIPGAIEDTLAAGLAYDGDRWLGSLRWRYFGDVPLIEDGSVTWDSSSIVNGRLGYRFAKGLELSLEVFNLLDSEDSDIEYFYASRLPGEPLGGFEDVHFHPMPERSARLVATWSY